MGSSGAEVVTLFNDISHYSQDILLSYHQKEFEVVIFVIVAAVIIVVI